MNRTIRPFLLGAVLLALSGCHSPAGQEAKHVASSAPASPGKVVSTPAPEIIAAEKARYEAMQKGVQAHMHDKK